MSFSFKDNEAYYVPVNSQNKDSVLSKFKPVLENENIGKIGQNCKYDNLVMRWHGVEVKGELFDTMIGHYLIEPDMRHKLDYLAETYLSYKMIPIEDLIGKRVKNNSAWQT